MSWRSFFGIKFGKVSGVRETTSTTVEESSIIREMIFDAAKTIFDPNFPIFTYEETPN